MPINSDHNGFIYWEDAMGTPSLGIESGRVEECLAELRRRNLKGAFGTVPYFQENNFDFLDEVPQLISAAFYDCIKLNDISGLYRLNNLRYLRLSGKRPALDFVQLAQIEEMVWEYDKRDCGIESQGNLEFLHLWRYRAPDASSFELYLPISLTELGLFWSNVETLDGFGHLPNLTTLDVSRCRNLRYLGAIAESFPNLKYLSITASGRLTAEEARNAIRGHPNLKHVLAGGELLLSMDEP